MLQVFLHEYLPPVLGTRARLGAAVVLGLFGVVALVEALVPETPVSAPVNAPLWNPTLAGLLIGALQLPILIFFSKSLGCSSSYVTVCAAAVTSPALKYFGLYRGGWKHNWQVLLVVGVLVGSLVCTLTSGEPWYSSRDSVSAVEAAVGGFLLLFGARMANGCPSGHGISGMAHLVMRSFLAVAFMFAGAIGTEFAFYNH